MRTLTLLFFAVVTVMLTTMAYDINYASFGSDTTTTIVTVSGLGGIFLFLSGAVATGLEEFRARRDAIDEDDAEGDDRLY